MSPSSLGRARQLSMNEVTNSERDLAQYADHCLLSPSLLHVVLIKRGADGATSQPRALLTSNTVLLAPSTEKAMAPHFSTLAWKIPWMEEPGRLQSMGSLRVGHD